MTMDYIRSFDIRLEKDVYYAGETLAGHIVLENTENIKIRGIRVVLRGKAHAEWKIMKSGERRTVKDDQYLLDEKSTIWGKDKHEDDGSIPILPRGIHQLPFKFNLPQSALPCSFESKAGTIRYYIKVVIDIPYASPPQGMKYFTVVGPHIDCMEEKYLNPMIGQDKKTVCCLCCQRGPLGLRVTLERTAYVCGENIRLHAQVENQSDQNATVKIKLVQYVEYFIDKGVLGVNKNLNYTVLEHKSPRVPPNAQAKYDSTLEQSIKLPVVPPTLIGVCRLIQIYYVLKVCLELEKSGDELSMDFPFTVATVPFRIPNSPGPPAVEYVSPEFQIGQVYDGTLAEDENVLLYRPVYVRIPLKTPHDKSSGHLAGTASVGKLSLMGTGSASGSCITHSPLTHSPSGQRKNYRSQSAMITGAAAMRCSSPDGAPIFAGQSQQAKPTTSATSFDSCEEDCSLLKQQNVNLSPAVSSQPQTTKVSTALTNSQDQAYNSIPNDIQSAPHSGKTTGFGSQTSAAKITVDLHDVQVITGSDSVAGSANNKAKVSPRKV